ncbi:hypothetical protein ACWGRK_17400 [Saccharomonospora azurea]|uniref:hypothetical protein n=1 Tax=Saccharomonospora azurea TaxID=40988 RepID=UPI00023FF079|nr:hypothetical protein [Saccharomonospora azurea]EHK87798.1 hypothetical protein SZMC14600_08439 [Saccharomonospora azurea SZMC 14600]
MCDGGVEGGSADVADDDESCPATTVGHRSIGDHTPLSLAVLDARARMAGADGESGVAAVRASREASDVEHWERRRHGRHVRLWVVRLEVGAAARNRIEAEFRLTRYVRRPVHRIGDVPVLRRTGVPEPDPTRPEGHRAAYPLAALVCHHDRVPFGELERVHVAAYVRALASARARIRGSLCDRTGEPLLAGASSSGVGDLRLGLWRVHHRVLCLAGPGEAPARARELAASVVDDAGRPAARVLDLQPDDGYVDGSGRRVHPAATLRPEAAAALWDDYDAAEADVGESSAVADVLARAAVQVWKTFADDARSLFR